MGATGPDPERLEREFPGWVAWVGVGGLWYAKRLSPPVSPPLVLRAPSEDEMRQRIIEAQGGGST